MTDEIKVLLIDDDPDFTQPMAFWLKSKGYLVTEVHSGEEGIAKVKESVPDIIFLDLNMPVMDGIETLKRIRKINGNVPVIVISAYVEKANTRDVEDYKISGVFYKGEDFQKGLSLLEAALRTHRKLKK
ncbi:MAG: response regulator [Candidatus Omnitrophica bacterium]|nr:response regulator [Candidatus Omnitrophota bacterium]